MRQTGEWFPLLLTAKLDARIIRALRAHGYDSLEQASGLYEEQFLLIDNVGRKCWERFQEAVSERFFSDEPTSPEAPAPSQGRVLNLEIEVPNREVVAWLRSVSLVPEGEWEITDAGVEPKRQNAARFRLYVRGDGLRHRFLREMERGKV